MFLKYSIAKSLASGFGIYGTFMQDIRITVMHEAEEMKCRHTIPRIETYHRHETAASNRRTCVVGAAGYDTENGLEIYPLKHSVFNFLVRRENDF